MIYVGPGLQIQVVRTYSTGLNQVTIHESQSGDFVYGDGKFVTDKAHFMKMPSPHRERAYAWFEKNFGEKTKKAVSEKTVAQEIVSKADDDDPNSDIHPQERLSELDEAIAGFEAQG